MPFFTASRASISTLPRSASTDAPAGGHQRAARGVTPLPLDVDERATLRARLHNSGVGLVVRYPSPVQLQDGRRPSPGYASGDKPHPGSAAVRILLLPRFPAISPKEIELVASPPPRPVTEP